LRLSREGVDVNETLEQPVPDTSAEHVVDAYEEGFEKTR
jgi:hypothetical protein